MAERYKRKKRRKKHFFLDLAIVVFSIIAIVIFLSSSYFDINSYDIVGNSRYTDKEITTMLDIKAKTNLIWLKKGDYEKKLEEDPFISEATISKKFPKELKVSVKERIPKATIKYGTKYVMIDKDGYILSLLKTRPRVTLIGGVKIKKMNLNEIIKVDNEIILNESLNCIVKARKEDLFFNSVTIDDDDIKINVYDYLWLSGKTENIMANIYSGNITSIIADLNRRKIKRGTIIVDSSKYCYYTPVYE